MHNRLCTLFGLSVLLWVLPVALAAQDCISGTVYEDSNNNGMQDAGENGLPGIAVSSVDQAGMITVSVTDGEGSYEFCEPSSGEYLIYPSFGGEERTSNPPDYTVIYTSGTAQDGLDFGVIDRSLLATLSGRAYLSYLDNGVQDPIEPALTGFTVTLTDNENISLSTLTNQFGNYEFVDLPLGRDYEISIAGNPANTEWIGGAVRMLGMVVNDQAEINFALGAASNFAGVYDRVCYDLNGDGQVDPQREPGLIGLVVELVDAEGRVIRTTRSDGNGRYGFTGIPAGSYTLRPVYDELDFRPTTPILYERQLGPLDPVPGGPFYFEPLRPRLRCGMAVQSLGTSQDNPTITLKAFDVRDRNPAPLGMNWSTVGIPASWTKSQIGRIRGIAIDNNFNIYLSSAGPGNSIHSSGTGGIQRISALTLAPMDVITTDVSLGNPVGTSTLPNSGDGIGNICINNTLNTILYATNLEDGSINVIDVSGSGLGTVLQTVAPFGAAADVVGIAYHQLQNRIYFGVRGNTGAGALSEVYSLALDGVGSIVAGPPQLEISVPVFPSAGRRPIFDLAFSHDYTELLLAERGAKTQTRVMHSIQSGSTWSAPVHVHFGSSTADAGGGVDFAYESFDPMTGFDETKCVNYFVATGGELTNSPPPGISHGIAIAPPGTTTGPYSTYVFVDSDGSLVRKYSGRQYDVEVFDCECPTAVDLPNCADDNGLEMLPSSPVDPAGIGDCCHILDYSNTGSIPVHAIDYTLLDGVQFQTGYQWDPTVDRVNYSSTSVTLAAPGLSGPLPNNVNGIFNFCLENITAVPQFLVIDYRNADYEIFCTDTLEFRCPLQAECLEYVQDSLVCDSLGYKFTIDFEVPPGNEFDIGYIKMNLTQALPAGTSWMPIGAFADPANSGHVFPTPLVPGDQVSLMYMITTMDDLSGDSLCILVTAHDDLEERLCCYAYEACIPFPDCPKPCDEVGARVVPSYQGDAATCCGGDPLEYQWLQDLIGDCTQRPCGAEVYCCELEDGTRVIRVAPDPAFPCADFPTELYGCDGTLIATSGGIAGGQLPPLVGCRKIYDCFEPDLNECCFDLLLTDTFTSDPGLITAIQTTILNSGITFSGQDRLGALLNGWTPTDLVPDRDILWNHSSGVTPNGVDQYLFSFCVEGTTSTDSVYVEVDFLNGRDSLICTDTVAVYCPYCLQIVNDSLTCVTDPLGNQTYLYEFSFVNSSAFDVNAVYISDEDTQALPDTVLNPGLHLLGSFVPPGATYTGTIPVEFDPGLDSACFDIVLRQIIGDSINISCCYATHCIELPPCDTLPQQNCPLEPNPDLICLDVYEPVCGCDDVTYSNICYAERAGVITWTPGPCPNVSDPIDDVTLVGQPGDAGNQLNWTVNPPPADYAFFLVRKRDDTEGDYWTIADIPATDVLAYDFLHVNAAMGLTTYQILAVRSDGRVVASNTVELLRREMMGLRTTVYAYPSPAREELHVTVNRLGDATLELVSTDGQISQREHATFNGNPYTVDMSGLGNGVYIVRLRFDDGEIVQQRVVRVRE